MHLLTRFPINRHAIMLMFPRLVLNRGSLTALNEAEISAAQLMLPVDRIYETVLLHISTILYIVKETILQFVFYLDMVICVM